MFPALITVTASRRASLLRNSGRGDRPDIVLVTSMMTYWYPGVFEAIRIISDLLPGTPVVLGGNYATLCRDHAVQNSGADVVLPGEGERILPALFKNHV